MLSVSKTMHFVLQIVLFCPVSIAQSCSKGVKSRDLKTQRCGWFSGIQTYRLKQLHKIVASSIQCPEDDHTSTVNMLTIMSKVRIEAFMWVSHHELSKILSSM